MSDARNRQALIGANPVRAARHRASCRLARQAPQIHPLKARVLLRDIDATSARNSITEGLVHRR